MGGADHTPAGQPAAARGDDRYFDLLLSEKEYADGQIAANLETNLKVLGTMFTVIVAALGWLFSTETGSDLDAEHLGVVLLALVCLGSIASLMGTVYNGLAFSYIAYKSGRLGELFAQHLQLPSNPLVASSFIGQTAAGRTTLVGTVLVGSAQTLLSLILLVAGSRLIWDSIAERPSVNQLFWVAVPLTSLLLLAAVTGSLFALFTLFKQRTSAPDAELRESAHRGQA